MRLRYVSILLSIAALAGLVPGQAMADSAYGQGGYSSCSFQNCPTPVPTPVPAPVATATPAPATPEPTPAPANTVITTASGMQYSVNLSDGQEVASGNYDLVITPLNGGGAALRNVEIFVDGVLVSSELPDSTGIVHVKWDTTKYSGSTVKVVLYDVLGAATVREFKIAQRKPATAAAAPATVPRSGLLALLPPALVDTIVAVGQKATHAIKQIPVPVARSFPYALFAVLGVGLAILVIQIRGEVAKSEAMMSLLKRERKIAEEKVTFLEQIQHYLRTPATLLKGALDLQSAKPELTPEVMDRLQKAVTSIGLTVEQLVKQIEGHILLRDIPDPEQVQSPIRAWASPTFFVPVGLIAVVTYAFNYLAVNVGEIDVGVVNVIVQLAVLIVLGLGLYLALRTRQVRRQNAEKNARVMEHQEAVDRVCNEFIRECSKAIAPSLQLLKDVQPDLGKGSIADVVQDGYGRYERIMDAFGAVARLETGKQPLELTQVQKTIAALK